ncbi:hypothetical protein ElyMa_003562500 [Elysia marginata]|uniref:Laminin N-terminal domain-containing protein n=1 Tax=Elysia marginata TaxID=1093978 RepID=A0AAV4EMG4_9GAST|nr:hypothetical protein ElyMa_003562500 [Elysia marginata]
MERWLAFSLPSYSLLNLQHHHFLLRYIFQTEPSVIPAGNSSDQVELLGCLTQQETPGRCYCNRCPEIPGKQSTVVSDFHFFSESEPCDSIIADLINSSKVLKQTHG